MLRLPVVAMAIAIATSACKPAGGSRLPSGVTGDSEPPDAGAGTADAGAGASFDAGAPGPDAGGPQGGGPGTPGLDAGIASIPPLPSGDVGCGSWLLEQPVPQARTLKGAWAASSSDVWAVGDLGTIVHWDGVSWMVVTSPTGADLKPIWGADATHVWAGGGGGVLIVFDGTAWRQVASPTSDGVYAIMGSAANDVWIQAGLGIFHWDGAQWTQPGDPSSRPHSTGTNWGGDVPIWPIGNGRAWSGGCPDGANASLYFWDGAAWTRTDTGVPGCISSIAGASPVDIWATATTLVDCGRVHCWSWSSTLHWDGARWSQQSTGSSIADNFFSPMRGEVWVPIYSGVDADVARLESGVFKPFLTARWVGISPAFAAVNPSDVFIAGSAGALAHFDGTATTNINGLMTPLYDLWGDASGAPWAVGESIVRRLDDRWQIIEPHVSGTYWALSGSSGDDVWMAGGPVALHWDGHAFTQWKSPDTAFLTAVWASPSGRAFFPSGEGLYRADVNGFTRVVDGPVTAVWGTTETNMWLIMPAPTGCDLVRFDGVATGASIHLPQTCSGYAFKALRGTASDDIWLLLWGRLLHFDGTSWNDQSPPAVLFSSFDVAGRNDVWASTGTDVWHFDGASWSTIKGVPGNVAVAGGAVYTVGGWARICRKP